MKILILRFSSIGDIVLTTPVVRCLKQQLGAKIHYLTKKAFEAVLSPNPHVDAVISFEKEVAEQLPALKTERYDWVIDLHHNLRSWQVKWALRRPARSFNKLNFEKWVLVRTGINLLPARHIVDRYMETVRHLGVKYDGLGLDYFIPVAEEVNLSDLSPNLQPGKYVVLAIGANHATKRLPADKIIQICRALEQPVVLLGGKSEREAGQKIADESGMHVLNACGRLSLHQSASVVRQAAKVATHDTGLMHIAAAFGKEIVSIWGSTVPEFGMYPFYPEGVRAAEIIEVPGLACRPCSKIGFADCPKGHFRCMNEQDLTRICRALK